MRYDFIRHTGPKDFSKDCKPFAAQPCARCGKMPENPLWAVCKACFGIIDVTKRHVNDQEVKRKARNTHNIILANKARRNRVKCICQQCGKEFEKQPNQVKIGKGKFCSIECSNNSKKK